MTRAVVALVVTAGLGQATFGSSVAADDTYLSWSAAQAQSIGESAYRKGRVGGFFDGRLFKTERAYNYKLAATLLSPSVVRASARLMQLRSRLTQDQTRSLVREAEVVGGAVVMVEIDPREGSGVIPLDWEAFLQPEGQPEAAVKGTNTPELRNVQALAGVLRRNYDYDRFWVVFPNDSDASYLKPAVQTIQLVVRIHDKEGRVEWPASLMHVR